MKVPVFRGRKAATARWAGFARAERLDWWKRKGAQLVDIPAERFAELSCVSEELVWADLRAGEVIQGIVVESAGAKFLRIVTRDPSAEEMLHFQAFRLPVVVHERHPHPSVGPMEDQPELF